MQTNIYRSLSLMAVLLSLSACSPKIYGKVQLFDANMNPVEDESPQGAVVNMINTTVALEEASHSVTVDEMGNFESEKKALKAGTHKVEVKKIGYETETETVELGSATKKELDIKLKKIIEGKRKSIEGTASDEDKIINPGEVNIRPPSM